MKLVDSASITNITDIDTVIGLTPAVKILLYAWTLIVIVLGIGGNGLVLLGSIKYHALRSDRISIFLLECVAVTDMLIATFDFIPTLIIIIANEWILGKSFCLFITIFEYVAYGTEIELIAAIAIFRCYLIANPFYAIPDLTYSRKMCFVTVAMALASVPTIVSFILGYKAFFNPFIFACDMSFSGQQSPIALFTITWSVLIPGFFLISSNIYLLNKAIKMTKDIEKKNTVKGMVMVLLLCGAFILSDVPFCFMICLGFTKDGPPGWLITLFNFTLGLNVFVNPIIYTFTNQRFFGFMKSLIGMK